MATGVLFHDRSDDFPEGDELTIMQVGARATKPYNENTGVDFTAMQTGRITLELENYDQDAWFITDKMKRDTASQIPSFVQANFKESSQAFRETMLTRILDTQKNQVLGDPNLINGFAHRYKASGAGNTLSLDDIRAAKLAFDKARIPSNGRVLLIDATHEYQLNALSQVLSADNPGFRGIVETGFGQDARFIRNIYGFDIMITDYLPRIASEDIGTFADPGNTSVITDAIAAQFLYLGDDHKKAYMGVIRQQPTSEFFRNSTWKRDEYSATMEDGYALQRPETLVTMLTSQSIA